MAAHDMLSVPLLFLVGVGAGVLATLAMDIVMPRLPEGSTTPFIASGVLTQTQPDDAPERLASVVHYLAGMLTGPLFVWLLLVSEALVGDLSIPAIVAPGLVLYVLMVAFFAIVVLPQSLVAEARVGPIRRDWAVSALVYLLVLVPVVGAAARLLRY